MRFRAYILLALLSLAVMKPARAESLDQMVQQLQTQLAEEQARSAEQNLSAGNTAAPTTAQPAQNQTPQQAPDRSNKNGAAKGLAMAGAAMALVGCMKLMKDAEEAQDEQTKALLKAMAMQQCSQGMKDMADAAKNDGNKQQLKMSDSPAQAQLPTQKLPTTKTASSPNITLPTPAPSNYEFTPLPTPTVAEKTKSKAQLEGQLDNTEEEIAADGGMTALKPIPEAKLGFDENSRGGGTTPAAGFGSVYGTNTASPTVKPADNPGKVGANGVVADSDSASSSRVKKSGGAPGSDDGGGSESSGSGKSDPFESMMAGLFGKNAEANSPFGAGFGTGISNGGGGGEAVGGDKKINIFEYASFRYKQASKKENRLKKLATRVLASMNEASPSEKPVAEALPGLVEAHSSP